MRVCFAVYREPYLRAESGDVESPSRLGLCAPGGGLEDMIKGV